MKDEGSILIGRHPCLCVDSHTSASGLVAARLEKLSLRVERCMVQCGNVELKIFPPSPLPPRHKEKIELDYDRFKDISTLSLSMKIDEGVWFGPIALTKGRRMPGPSDPVVLSFTVHNRRLQCVDGCEVVFIVDGC